MKNRRCSLLCLSLFFLSSVLNAATSVSRYGITWIFDKDYPCGQFVNGDWWVTPNPGQNAVTVVSVTPSPTKTSVGKLMNGSMINPMPGFQAMDERGPVWKAELGCSYSLALKANQSLFSAKSLAEDHPLAIAKSNSCKIHEVEVLTCLAQPALPTDFRPPYVGADKPLYSSLKLRRDLLPNLPPPDKVEVPDMKALTAARFSRPWVEFLIGYAVKELNSPFYESGYGRNKATEVGGAALLLCLDRKVVGDKEPLLIGMVQTGIDLYYSLVNGGNWHSNGGFNSGRKFPILFAGLMLDDKAMLDIGNKYPPESNTFQEDAQAFIITQADVDRKLACMAHGPAKSAGPAEIGLAGKSPADPDGLPGMTEVKGLRIKIVSGPGAGQVRLISKSDAGWKNPPKPLITCTVEPPWEVAPVVGESVFQVLGFQKEDIGKAAWSASHLSTVKWLSPVIEKIPGVAIPTAKSPESDNPSAYQPYNHLNKHAWPGQVLAARILGLRAAWNANAVFLLEDQYMNDTVPGGAYYGKLTPRVYSAMDFTSYNSLNKGTDIPSPDMPKFSVSGEFISAMWDTYRPKADELGAESIKKRK